MLAHSSCVLRSASGTCEVGQKQAAMRVWDEKDKAQMNLQNPTCSIQESFLKSSWKLSPNLPQVVHDLTVTESSSVSLNEKDILGVAFAHP